MKELSTSAFVSPFYRQFLGFWVLLLVFTTVFMEYPQHVLLAEFIYRNPILPWVLPLIFLSFSTLVLSFQKELLRRSSYTIFHHLGLWPKAEFRSHIFQVWISTHAFLMVYLAFLSIYGIKAQAFLTVSILWLVIFFSFVLHLNQIKKTLSKPIKEKLFSRPFKRLTLPPFSWLMVQLKEKRPLLLLSTKGLSLILLSGFFTSYATGRYDIRWLLFAGLIAAYFHLPILMERMKMEGTSMNWFKSLPSHPWRKSRDHILGLGLILAPEILMIFWRGIEVLSAFEVVYLAIYMLSLVLGLLGLLKWIRLKSFDQRILIPAFFIVFITIIFYFHPLYISIVSFCLFVFMMRHAYEQ
ncbi:hypothetical protein [Algoriphagus sediminis]|uniref:ABC transporter permease n=1 Tax=Algoriphagus sediminis TaxID=3057113 RepID=A0ABT7Y9K9_9BACT|nr:hypothetical protein [Algoriphagus sediminis]MDN3203192.1 hypothetical protein [Algoriphagus sediminis]